MVTMTEKTLDEQNKQITKRLNIIRGQLEGLRKMIINDEYCIDLINQSRSIQNSLKSLDALLLERHLRMHVLDQFVGEKETAVKELLKVFRQSSKNR